MLVLTRTTEQTIIIGDGDVEIKILGVRGNQVRIGIKAPQSTNIFRKEIYDRIKRNDKSA